MCVNVQMETMVKRLYEASVVGDVTSLNELIELDKLILERCRIVTSYRETPLHIVAMLGHLDFCLEVVRINPLLVPELDSRLSSALHLASARGHTEIVLTLASAGPEMCFKYDEDGYNPIHLAAMKGRVDVLKELAKLCPNAVWATCQGGNVLHLCVSYKQTEALKFLIGLQNSHQFLNSVDSCGNSILHLAVGHKQVEIIQYLVSLQPSIEVNTKNSNGLTALDILSRQPKRDSKYMKIAQILQGSSGGPSYFSCGHLSEINSERGKQHVWVDEQRNSLMVVASLIATMAFQAGVNPPTGFKPATEIYNAFVIANTIGFLSSLSVILLFISGLPIQHKVFMWAWTAIMWVSIAATTCTYTISLSTISDWRTYSIAFRLVIAAWFDLMALLFLGHTIRILSQRIQVWPNKNKCFLWIFIVIMWIIASLLRMQMIPIYSLHHHMPFAMLFTGWIVVSALLILLYAIQLVFFIRKNWKTWYDGFKSYIRSSYQATVV